MIPIRCSAKTMEMFASLQADMARLNTTTCGVTNDDQIARASQIAHRLSRNAQSFQILLRGEIADAKARERRDAETRKVGTLIQQTGEAR